MEKRVLFKSAWLPWALIAPQMIIILVFFFWPAGQALYQSVLQQDAFGTTAAEFVGDRIDLVLTSAGDDDRRAERGEQSGHPRADPGTTAGDQNRGICGL